MTLKTTPMVPLSILPAKEIVLVHSMRGRGWAALTAASLSRTQWANSLVSDVREGFVLWVNPWEVSAIKSMGN